MLGLVVADGEQDVVDGDADVAGRRGGTVVRATAMSLARPEVAARLEDVPEVSGARRRPRGPPPARCRRRPGSACDPPANGRRAWATVGRLSRPGGTTGRRRFGRVERAVVPRRTTDDDSASAGAVALPVRRLSAILSSARTTIAGSVRLWLVSTAIVTPDSGRQRIAERKPSRRPEWPRAAWPSIVGRLDAEPVRDGRAVRLGPGDVVEHLLQRDSLEHAARRTGRAPSERRRSTSPPAPGAASGRHDRGERHDRAVGRQVDRLGIDRAVAKR